MIIALDVDDTLLALYPSLCKRFGKEPVHTNIWDGEGACKWIANEFPLLYNVEDGFWENLEFLSNPKDIDFEFHCYITAIPHHLMESRRRNLKKLGFPDKPIICTEGSKLDAMREHGIDILIDDKPSTVREINESGDKTAIQFVPYYMTGHDVYHPLLTVYNLDEVGPLLENLNLAKNR